jgi:hypothetical protein
MDTTYKIEPGVTEYDGFQLLKATDMKPPCPLSIALAAAMKTDREPHIGSPVIRTYVG